VVDRSGNLYGANNAGGPQGVGDAFEYRKVGGYNPLFYFPALGAYPSGNVLLSPTSRTTWLYGGTSQGGPYNTGMVYKISLTTGDGYGLLSIIF
jgi:uncharacterized repeat protein (TIGR03803 family)